MPKARYQEGMDLNLLPKLVRVHYFYAQKSELAAQGAKLQAKMSELHVEQAALYDYKPLLADYRRERNSIKGHIEDPFIAPIAEAKAVIAEGEKKLAELSRL